MRSEMVNDMIRLGYRAAALKATPGMVANAQSSLREVVLAELNLPLLPRKRVPVGTLIMGPETATESLHFVVDGRIRL